MLVRFSRRPAAAALVLGVAAVALLVPAAPAVAVPGQVTVHALSPADSSMFKTVTATCPAGTTVIGGGGYISGDPSQLLLTGLRPVVSWLGTGFQALAAEDDTGYAGNWRVTSYAVCAPAPPGLGYGWLTSPTSSESSRTVTATCSPGKRVLGAGGIINNGGRDVSLGYILPTFDLTKVVVQAHEDETGQGASWSLTSWVVCADPPPGLERVVGGVGTTAWPTAAYAGCPAGKRVFGVGGVITGGAGEVKLLGAYPYVSQGAYVFGDEDATGYGGNWSPTAIAICGY